MSSSGQKSSIAQTCNFLSQYFKENGRFAAKLEANKGVETMNWSTNLENSAEISRQNVKANDFFANIPILASSNLKSDAILEQGSSQMTIFYAGKVFVFSEFPAEKAKEIMALATKGSSNVTPDLNMVPSTSVSNNNNNNKNIATPVQFKKASLQRFFEKRKDRVAARGPYQVKNHSSMAAVATPKPEDQSKYSGLEIEGQSSKQLDLRL